jgi:hypothetical protein
VCGWVESALRRCGRESGGVREVGGGGDEIRYIVSGEDGSPWPRNLQFRKRITTVWPQYISGSPSFIRIKYSGIMKARSDAQFTLATAGSPIRFADATYSPIRPYSSPQMCLQSETVPSKALASLLPVSPRNILPLHEQTRLPRQNSPTSLMRAEIDDHPIHRYASDFPASAALGMRG